MTEDPMRWKTIDEDVTFRCPGFEVITETVELPDGTETTFDYVSEPPVVVILPFTPDGLVVTIEEWRQAVKRVNVGLPAGTMEPEDSDIVDTVHRELTEETGYIADRVSPLLVAEPANGLLNVEHHYYVAYDCTATGEQTLDFNESIRVMTREFETLIESIRTDDVSDARTALCLLYYRLFDDG